MVKIYAELIRKGLKTLEQVPTPLKNQVQQILVDLDIKLPR